MDAKADLFTPEELVSIEKALLAAGPSFLATLGRNTSAPHNSGGPAGQGSVIAYGGQYSGPGAPQMKQPPPYNPSCQAGSAVPHMMMRPAEAATGRPSQLAQQTLMGRVVPQYPRHLVGQQPHKQTQQTPPYNPSCQAGSAMPQMMMRLAEAATGRPSQPAQQTLMGRVVPQYPRHLVGQQPHKQTQQPPPYNPSCQAGSAMPQMMMRPAEAATGRPSQPAQQTLFVRVHVEPQFPRHPAGQQSRKLAGVGIIAPTHSLGLSLPSPSLPEPSYDVMSPHLGMLGALVSSFPEPKYDESSQRTKGGGRGQLRTASSSRPLRNSKQHLRRIKVEEVTPERRPWPYPSVQRPS